MTGNSMLDPWFRPYVIVIDEDNNGGISNVSSSVGGITFSGEVIRDTVGVMSWGRNPTNTSGWLRSWVR